MDKPAAEDVGDFGDFGSAPPAPADSGLPDGGFPDSFGDFGEPTAAANTGFADFGTFEAAAPANGKDAQTPAALDADISVDETRVSGPTVPAPEKPKLSKEEKAARKAARATAAAEEEEDQRRKYEEQRAIRLQKLEQQQKATTSSSSWGGWLSSTLTSPSGGLSSLQESAEKLRREAQESAEKMRREASRRAEEAAAAFQTPSKAMDDIRERLQSGVGSLSSMPVLGFGTPSSKAADSAGEGVEGGATNVAAPTPEVEGGTSAAPVRSENARKRAPRGPTRVES